MVGPNLAAGLLTAAIATAPESAVLLEASFEPAQVYVQAQALYRLRLYQAVDVRDLKLSVAAPRLADWRQSGPERVYETLRDGRRYRVHERSYAIRPFTSGALVLSGARAEGRIPASGTPDGRRALRLEAAAQTLQVLPVPAGFGDAAWLPAHALNISEVWTPEQKRLQVGQAQRRSIRIEASGVDAGQLPELQMAAPGMAIHADPARLENRLAGALNIGVREQSFTMVALRAGTLVAPRIQVHWWNVDSNLAAVATLPPHTLQAGAAEASATPERSPPSSNAAGTLATWTAAGIVLLLSTAPLLWWRRRGDGVRAAWRLGRACATKDLHGVRDNLLEWTALIWPQSAAFTLGALAERLRDRVARGALAELERALYGPTAVVFDKRTLTMWTHDIKRAVRRERRNNHS